MEIECNTQRLEIKMTCKIGKVLPKLEIMFENWSSLGIMQEMQIFARIISFFHEHSQYVYFIYDCNCNTTHKLFMKLLKALGCVLSEDKIWKTRELWYFRWYRLRWRRSFEHWEHSIGIFGSFTKKLSGGVWKIT